MVITHLLTQVSCTLVGPSMGPDPGNTARWFRMSRTITPKSSRTGDFHATIGLVLGITLVIKHSPENPIVTWPCSNGKLFDRGQTPETWFPKSDLQRIANRIHLGWVEPDGLVHRRSALQEYLEIQIKTSRQSWWFVPCLRFNFEWL
jgi:hypothetical protein